MTRASETIRAVVNMPGGAVILDVPWWANDANIIRDAIRALPPALAVQPEKCTVERPRRLRALEPRL